VKVLIIGAGAIGSLVAHRLGQAGHSVTVVARAPYVRALNQRGLLIAEDGRATSATGIRAVEHTDALGEARFDLVLITTKAFDTAVAAVQAHPFVRSGAQVIVLQNGVGGVEIARGILTTSLVGGNLFAGVITISVEVLKPAVIEPHYSRSARGGLGIAPVESGHGTASSLTRLFSESGFQVRGYRNWRAIKWSKLMLNMLANTIPAIVDQPLEAAYASPGLYALERAALIEARAVARRLGARPVSLPGYPVPLLTRMLCDLPAALTYPLFQRAVVGARGGKQPSLHIDLSRGRTRSEVEFLNGAVVRAGEKLGLPTPVNRILYETLTGIAQKKIEWENYRGQPERLIRRVAHKHA
jgi:2-dehydropantoate 2-reductase